jgi:hypothetical protein
MILGRWSSDAFLVYIRPQVLEWTNNMSCDMIHLDSFFDAPHRDLVAPDDPRTRKRLKASFNGRDNIDNSEVLHSSLKQFQWRGPSRRGNPEPSLGFAKTIICKLY